MATFFLIFKGSLTENTPVRSSWGKSVLIYPGSARRWKLWLGAQFMTFNSYPRVGLSLGFERNKRGQGNILNTLGNLKIIYCLLKKLNVQ